MVAVNPINKQDFYFESRAMVRLTNQFFLLPKIYIIAKSLVFCHQDTKTRRKAFVPSRLCGLTSSKRSLHVNWNNGLLPPRHKDTKKSLCAFVPLWFN